jgi:hypothetical protein
MVELSGTFIARVNWQRAKTIVLQIPRDGDGFGVIYRQVAIFLLRYTNFVCIKAPGADVGSSLWISIEKETDWERGVALSISKLCGFWVMFSVTGDLTVTHLLYLYE